MSLNWEKLVPTWRPKFRVGKSLLSLLSCCPVLVHILLPETDKCPSWISRRERMIIEKRSFKECSLTWQGSNPQPPDDQSDAHSTEPPRLAEKNKWDKGKLMQTEWPNHNLQSYPTVLCSELTRFSRETPKRVTGKQCRPRSDAAECGIWSGSTLFALNTEISISVVIIKKQHPTSGRKSR